MVRSNYAMGKEFVILQYINKQSYGGKIYELDVVSSVSRCW